MSTWVGVGGWVGGRAGVAVIITIILGFQLLSLKELSWTRGWYLCLCARVRAQQNIFINHILGFLLHIIYKTKSRYKLSCSHWLQLHLISYYWMRNLTNSSLDYISSYIFHAWKFSKRSKIHYYVINQMLKFQVFAI